MTGFLTSFSDNGGEVDHDDVVDEEVDDDDMKSWWHIYERNSTTFVTHKKGAITDISSAGVGLDSADGSSKIELVCCLYSIVFLFQ